MDADIKNLLDKLGDVERSIKMVRHEVEQGQPSGSALVNLECDAEELVELILKTRVNRSRELKNDHG